MPGELIGGIISGVMAVGAAKKQAMAAKKAAEAQQVGTDKALAALKEANAPYLALGQQAAQRLQQTPFQPYTQQFRPGQPNNGYQAPQGPPPTLGSIGQPQGQPGQPPQMVRLQAPDGSISPRPFSPEEAFRTIQQARSAGHELKVVQ